ncbi:hypothetical protein HELRODRAFT_153609, partial [Helobdella robusta]|uniref:RING-type domain-containing protein n=1 Tax=Helobdella robusta TaxID=6412 RepID=T1EL96_HELRO
DEMFLNTSCCICLDDFETGDFVWQLQCCHNFHSHCVYKWLREKRNRCPLCSQ